MPCTSAGGKHRVKVGMMGIPRETPNPTSIYMCVCRQLLATRRRYRDPAASLSRTLFADPARNRSTLLASFFLARGLRSQGFYLPSRPARNHRAARNQAGWLTEVGRLHKAYGENPMRTPLTVLKSKKKMQDSLVLVVLLIIEF